MISYKKYLKALKRHELEQLKDKGIRDTGKDVKTRAFAQMRIATRKLEINELLEIISVHKQAMYYYGKCKDLEKELGKDKKA